MTITWLKLQVFNFDFHSRVLMEIFIIEHHQSFKSNTGCTAPLTGNCFTLFFCSENLFGKHIPFGDCHDGLLQLVSLMNPLGDIIAMSQSTTPPTGIYLYLYSSRLRVTSFAETFPFFFYIKDHIYDASFPESKTFDSIPLLPSNLIQLTPNICHILRDAMNKQFEYGYNRTTASLLVEPQVFFTLALATCDV